MPRYDQAPPASANRGRPAGQPVTRFACRADRRFPPLIQRPVPSTGELLPVMGMGTSRTFDTAGDAASLAALLAVMRVLPAAVR